MTLVWQHSSSRWKHRPWTLLSSAVLVFLVLVASQVSFVGWSSRRGPWLPKSGPCKATAANQRVEEDASKGACITAMCQNAQEGDIQGVLRNFDRMQRLGFQPDESTYDAVIMAFAKAGDAAQAEAWVGRMVQAGLTPTGTTYSTVAEAWATAGNPEQSERWLQDMLDAGFKIPEAICRAVMESFQNSGKQAQAERWQLRLAAAEKREAGERSDAKGPAEGSSRGSAIIQYAKNGDPMRAAQWLKDMLLMGFSPPGECFEAVADSFAAQGDSAKAKLYLARCIQAGFRPKVSVVLSILGAVALRGETAPAISILDLAISAGVQLNATAYNEVMRAQLVADLQNCGALDASRTLHQMKASNVEPNDESYALVIQGFVRSGSNRAAFDHVQEMITAGVTPQASLSIGIVHSCLERKELPQMEFWLEQKLLPEVQKSKELQGAFITQKFARGATAAELMELVDRMVATGAVPDSATLSAVVDASGEETHDGSLDWLQKMMSSGHKPSSTSVTSFLAQLLASNNADAAARLVMLVDPAAAKPELVEGLSKLAALSVARGEAPAVGARWLAWIAGQTPETLSTWCTIKVAEIARTMLGTPRRGEPQLAGQVLLELKEAGVAFGLPAYSALVIGWSDKDQATEAQLWFDRLLQAGHSPDAKANAALINALARQNLPRAIATLDKLEKERRELDPYGYTTVISMLAEQGKAEEAEAWFQRIYKNGLQPDKATFNALIKAKAKKGDSQSAVAHFKEMKDAMLVPTRITYNTIISLFARRKQADEAVTWFHRMLSDGVIADTISYNAVINAFSGRREVDKASEWLRKMQRDGVPADAFSYNELIRGCYLSGDVDGAAKWLEKMKEAHVAPDAVSYNLIINACAKASNAVLAKKWLVKMEEAGIKPGVVAWSAYVKACGVARPPARAEAEQALRTMVSRGIRPDVYTTNSVDKVLGKDRRKELYVELLGSEGAEIAKVTPPVTKSALPTLRFSSRRRAGDIAPPVFPPGRGARKSPQAAKAAPLSSYGALKMALSTALSAAGS